MKCPYITPTVSQCGNCPYPDCVRSLTVDHNEKKAEWIRNNPDKRKAIRRRYYLNHMQSAKEYQKQYREKNIEEVRRKDREKKALKRQRAV